MTGEALQTLGGWVSGLVVSWLAQWGRRWSDSSITDSRSQACTAMSA